METLKPQPSLRGFVAYALRELVKQRGMSQAEGAAWIIDRWIEEHYEMLATRYGITLEKYAVTRQAAEQPESKA